MTLIVDLIPKGKENRPGEELTVTKITVHNTDNDEKGSGAKAHSKFLKNVGYYIYEEKTYWVSWHFTCDDIVSYQHLPVNEVGYHAKRGNSKSLGVEICMNQGIDQEAANDRAAKLVARLLKANKLDVSDVVTHKYWTSKKCPSQLLDNGKEGERWKAFLALIQHYLSIKTELYSSPLTVTHSGLKPVTKETDFFDMDHGLLKIGCV